MFHVLRTLFLILVKLLCISVYIEFALCLLIVHCANYNFVYIVRLPGRRLCIGSSLRGTPSGVYKGAIFHIDMFR